MRRYFFGALVACALPLWASAATLTFGGSTQASVGGTLNVPVYLSTAPGESANAVSATVSYPSSKLTLVGISKAGSIISLWPQDPTMASGSGAFEGIILNPGWSGTQGKVVTLTFQVDAPGDATLVFSDASVLANDGNATPILSSAPSQTVSIAAAPPAPSAAPTKTQTTPTKPVSTPPTSSVAPATSTPATSTAPVGSIAPQQPPAVASTTPPYIIWIWVALLALLALGIGYVLGDIEGRRHSRQSAGSEPPNTSGVKPVIVLAPEYTPGNKLHAVQSEMQEPSEEKPN